METMPVKYETFEYAPWEDELESVDLFGQGERDPLLYPYDDDDSSPQPLSHDAYTKFDLECKNHFSTSYFEEIMKGMSFDNPLETLLFSDLGMPESLSLKVEPNDVMINNHDCMWAGHCASSEHPEKEWFAADKSDENNPPSLIGTGAINAAVARQDAPIQAPSQLSLLKPALRSAGLPILTLDTPTSTPPMSDDEDKSEVKRPQVLKLHHHTPSHFNDDDADQDLLDYFGEDLDDLDDLDDQQSDETSSSSEDSSSSESEDEEEPQPDPAASRYPDYCNVTSKRSNVYATKNDHSYYKESASMSMSDLGIYTPSDTGESSRGQSPGVPSESESEIDVVSVPKTGVNPATRLSYALPTNPTVIDRQNLQKTMETAMNTGRRTNNSNGLKTILPVKRPAAAPAQKCPPAKRKATAANTKKTNKRTTNPTSYKRRTRVRDSESDPEPSEKRSLHNNMERQRRVDLRNSFECLRQLVPELMTKERAAKVAILRGAKKYCDHLTQDSMRQTVQANDLRLYQIMLRKKLKELRSDLAQQR